MKRVLIVTSLWFSLSALSTAPDVLLVKQSGGGHTPPDWAVSETCKLFADRIEVVHSVGRGGANGIAIKEIHPLSVVGKIPAMIEAAKQQKLYETENMLCDGPSTEVMGFTATGEQVLLYETGGCGNARRDRAGAAARNLRFVMDKYCPTQH